MKRVDGETRFSVGKYYQNRRYEMRESGHRSTAKFYNKGPAADPKGIWIMSLTEDEIVGPVVAVREVN